MSGMRAFDRQPVASTTNFAMTVLPSDVVPDQDDVVGFGLCSSGWHGGHGCALPKLLWFGRQHSLRRRKAQDAKLPFRPAELAEASRTTGWAIAAWLSRPGCASVRLSQQNNQERAA